MKASLASVKFIPISAGKLEGDGGASREPWGWGGGHPWHVSLTVPRTQDLEEPVTQDKAWQLGWHLAQVIWQVALWVPSPGERSGCL